MRKVWQTQRSIDFGDVSTPYKRSRLWNGRAKVSGPLNWKSEWSERQCAATRRCGGLSSGDRKTEAEEPADEWASGGRGRGNTSQWMTSPLARLRHRRWPNVEMGSAPAADDGPPRRASVAPGSREGERPRPGIIVNWVELRNRPGHFLNIQHALRTIRYDLTRRFCPRPTLTEFRIFQRSKLLWKIL